MNKRTFRRPLDLETLEVRRVFYSYVNWTPPIAPGASATEHAAHYAKHNFMRASDTSVAGLESFDSRAEVDARLSALANSYWSGLLGKPVAEVQAVGYAQRYEIADSYGLQFSLSKFRTKIDGRVEADALAKTSDGIIYIPSNSGIEIVDARDPADMKSSYFTNVGTSFDSALWVDGNRLIRASIPLELYSDKTYGVDARAYRPTTRIEVFDISNRTSPVLTGQLMLEGDYVAAAVQNGRLTLVQFSDPNLLLPQPAVETRADGTQVFESSASYIARNRDAIYADVIPNYQRRASAEAQPISEDIGDWRDINVAFQTLQHRAAVLTIQLDGEPKVIDSELVLGLREPMVYVAQDNVYLLDSSGTGTEIYRLSVGANGEVDTTGHVTLSGKSVTVDRVDEYNGILRLYVGPSWTYTPGVIDRSSTLLTIGDSQGQWRVQGQVQVASSILPTGIHFDGPRAIVLAGENYHAGRPATNYIASLDLSDPTAPRRLNGFQIPGFSTHLKQIDAEHWIGLRYDSPDSRGYHEYNMVVSLYRNSGETGLSLVDSWTDKTNFFNSSAMYSNGFEIDYDPASRLVMIDGGLYRPGGVVRSAYNPILLRFQPGGNDPLQPVDIPGVPEVVQRTFVMDGHLFVLTASSLVAFDTSDLTTRQDIALLSSEYDVDLAGAGFRLEAGKTQTIPVFGGYGSDFYTITSVEVAGQLSPSQQSKVEVLPNGQLQVQAANVDISTSEFLTIKVRYFDGREAEVYRSLLIVGPSYRPQEDAQNYFESNSRTYYESLAPVEITTRFVDQSGQPVDQLRNGDEAWVVIAAEDLSELRLGVFGASFQVTFANDNLEVLGEPEFLGIYRALQVTASDDGFSVLSGAASNWQPTGVAGADIVRFKVRVTDNRPVTITVAPTEVPNQGIFQKNILVNMGSEIHSTGNAQASVLSTDPLLNGVQANATNSQADINQDGDITALDVLLIINYINSGPESAAESVGALRSASSLVSRFDISGDGAITGLDALLVINTINMSQISTASAEGEGSAGALDSQPTWSIDQLFAGDATSDIMRKLRRN